MATHTSMKTIGDDLEKRKKAGSLKIKINVNEITLSEQLLQLKVLLKKHALKSTSLHIHCQSALDVDEARRLAAIILADNKILKKITLTGKGFKPATKNTDPLNIVIDAIAANRYLTSFSFPDYSGEKVATDKETHDETKLLETDKQTSDTTQQRKQIKTYLQRNKNIHLSEESIAYWAGMAAATVAVTLISIVLYFAAYLLPPLPLAVTLVVIFVGTPLIALGAMYLAGKYTYNRVLKWAASKKKAALLAFTKATETKEESNAISKLLSVETKESQKFKVLIEKICNSQAGKDFQLTEAEVAAAICRINNAIQTGNSISHVHLLYAHYIYEAHKRSHPIQEYEAAEKTYTIFHADAVNTLNNPQKYIPQQRSLFLEVILYRRLKQAKQNYLQAPSKKNADAITDLVKTAYWSGYKLSMVSSYADFNSYSAAPFIFLMEMAAHESLPAFVQKRHSPYNSLPFYSENQTELNNLQAGILLKGFGQSNYPLTLAILHGDTTIVNELNCAWENMLEKNEQLRPLYHHQLHISLKTACANGNTRCQSNLLYTIYRAAQTKEGKSNSYERAASLQNCLWYQQPDTDTSTPKTVPLLKMLAEIYTKGNSTDTKAFLNFLSRKANVQDLTQLKQFVIDAAPQKSVPLLNSITNIITQKQPKPHTVATTKPATQPKPAATATAGDDDAEPSSTLRPGKS